MKKGSRKLSSSSVRYKNTKKISIKPEAYENPFRINKDDDIFEMRDREKMARKKEREKQKMMKIWEKNPTAPYKLLVKSNIKSSTADDNAATMTKLRKSRRPAQENLPAFIAKKRDMFLMQMSLNTKNEEIKKLEDKARMKDEALDRSEKMLEIDATRFDEFLQKNDREAHRAFEIADKEIKDKQEKIEELKKLNIEMTKIENEISKLEYRLKECEKYKTFLLEVAADGLGTRESVRPQQGRPGGEEEDSGGDHQSPEATQGNLALAGDDTKDGGSGYDFDLSPVSPVSPVGGGCSLSLPFETPEQLLDIFAQKEEENLFLIQILQRAEEELDQLQRRYLASTNEMNKTEQEANRNIEEIDAKIRFQESKINALRNPSSPHTNNTTNTTSAGKGGKGGLCVVSMHSSGEINEQVTRKLDNRIKHVYDDCLHAGELDPVIQLKEIEVRVEKLLGAVLKIPADERSLLETEKETQRRAYGRKLKMEEMDRLTAERAEKSKARAAAETFKRTGKALMPRMQIAKYKRKTEKKSAN